MQQIAPHANWGVGSVCKTLSFMESLPKLEWYFVWMCFRWTVVSSKHPLTAGCFNHFLKVHQVLHGCSRTDADRTSGGPFGDSWLWLEKMLCTDGMCSYFVCCLVKFTNTNQRNWFSHSSNFCQPQRSLLLANLRLKWRLCFTNYRSVHVPSSLLQNHKSMADAVTILPQVVVPKEFIPYYK